MPAKNILKIYAPDSYYHVYNRGVDKRTIFQDDLDYRTFLHLLKLYLSAEKKPDSALTRTDLVRPRPVQPINDEVKLVSYCLMPNHFHLLVKQRTETGMTKLLRRVATTYSVYFNTRYSRSGTLFQGRYRAVLVNSEEQLLHLSRYIHLNPAELTRTDLVNYAYSSYPYYLGKKHADWLNLTPVLSYFHSAAKDINLKGINSYRSFVEDYKEDPSEIIGSSTLDEH